MILKVDLLNTKNAPKGLFAAIEEENEHENAFEIYIDVPKTDYRAIRRAILDLDEFYIKKIITIQHLKNRIFILFKVNQSNK